MPARRLKRYIALNLAVWCGLALFGALLLTGVRQYGQAVMARHAAGGLAADARAAHDRGAALEAQRTLRAALAADPGVGEAVVRDFGPALSGMPLVLAGLDALRREHPERLSEEAQLLGVLVARPPDTLHPKVFTLDPPGDAGLWLGRAALANGDLKTARDAFRRYWERPGGAAARVRARSALAPGPAAAAADQYLQGRRFWFAGLWDEAFAAFDGARKGGHQNSDLECFAAVRAELDGNRDAALAGYRAVAAKAPRHRLALLRLRALTPAAK
ncbi:MAG: hypothetical protein GXY15_03525 [Candidatus Hydrogenedentes bacterium]|nr:hypothetical protein [Candidatus Hydrogenedentota bacterium]